MPPATGTYVKVFLLDDHDIVRQGLRDLLTPARDIRVVGDSGSARVAQEAILRLEAQVMVLDLHLQDGSGVQVCRRVRAIDPSVQGLLLTSADDDEALAAAVLAGAAGYVVKLARTSDVLGAIRRLGEGHGLMDDDLAESASRMLRARADACVPALSEDQLAVLDHVLAGRTDAEVARLMGRELAATQDDVAALIARLTSAPAVSPAVHGQPGGKHRRVL